jgi:carbamate kinase
MAPVVVALGRAALDERGWPTLAEDPVAALGRAARSIAYVASRHSVVVTHCLSEAMGEALRRALEVELDGAVPSLAEPDAATIDATIEGFAGRRFVVLCSLASGGRCHEDVASDLAVRLDGEMLVLLVGEPVVWQAGDERGVRSASPESLGTVSVDASMAPVLDAASRFVETTGRRAAIGAIDHTEAMVEGQGGTVIRDDKGPVRFYGTPLGQS